LYFSDENPLLHPATGTPVPYFERSRQQLSVIRRLSPAIETSLDYGSGPGYALFLSEAPVKHAIEPDEHSFKYLDHLGAQRVSLEALPPRYYDVVLSSHSLEHLPVEHLRPTLAALGAALKPTGLLCVEVPSAPLGQLDLPLGHEPHTLFFSPKALTTLLHSAGFEIVHAEARVPGARARLVDPLVAVDQEDPWESSANDGLFVVARLATTAPAVWPVGAYKLKVLRGPEA
jgi:hypothetical protein